MWKDTCERRVAVKGLVWGRGRKVGWAGELTFSAVLGTGQRWCRMSLLLVTRDGTIIDGCISDAAVAATAVTARTTAAVVPVVAAAYVVAAVVRRGRKAGLDFQDFRRGTARTGT